MKMIFKKKTADMRFFYTTNIEASPRKIKNPKTSVAVVTNMIADVAGSFPKDFIITGTRAPNKPATTRLRRSAIPTTRPRSGL